MHCTDLKINLAYVIIKHNTYYGITTEFVLVIWEVELDGMLCICEDFILFEVNADYVYNTTLLLISKYFCSVYIHLCDTLYNLQLLQIK